MFGNTGKGIIVILLGAISCVMLNAQGFLDNDTLYIDSVAGSPGSQVEVQIHVRSTIGYIMVDMPLTFGTGSSEVYCDSVSLIGSVMEDWLTYTFANNCQWDGVQTCGVNGIAKNYVPLAPGYHFLYTAYFTINSGASYPQDITIDTTSCSFFQYGPITDFEILGYDYEYYVCHVVGGNIHVQDQAVNENEDFHTETFFELSPTIVQSGGLVRINFGSSRKSSVRMVMYDAIGSIVDVIHDGAVQEEMAEMYYSLDKIARGVYFVVIEEQGKGIDGKKLVVR